jgi:import inner membrane translocase subunit TIM21
MLVTFWVHGRGRDEPEPLGWIKGIWNGVEENLRWIGGVMGVSEPYEPGQEVAPTVSTGQVPSQVEKSKSGNGGGWFSGLAGSLRGGLSTGTRSGESRRGLPPAGTYKIGEVKAEYVKVCPMPIINLPNAPQGN